MVNAGYDPFALAFSVMGLTHHNVDFTPFLFLVYLSQRGLASSGELSCVSFAPYQATGAILGPFDTLSIFEFLEFCELLRVYFSFVDMGCVIFMSATAGDLFYTFWCCTNIFL